MLTILGIKYVAASPNEKADYKKGMTVYVVGAVLLFGASALLSVIQKFVEGK
jgi:type IV secretory pathway VirB2 component (pilin)